MTSMYEKNLNEVQSSREELINRIAKKIKRNKRTKKEG